MFYTPKLLWNAAEGGLVKALCDGLSTTMHKPEEVYGRKTKIVKYMTDHISVSTLQIQVMVFACPRERKHLKYSMSNGQRVTRTYQND